MCEYAGGKSISGERTSEVFLSVPARESGLNDTNSAKRNPEGVTRPTDCCLGYELVLCFSTPIERHSRGLKVIDERFWTTSVTTSADGANKVMAGGLDGCSGRISATFAGPRSHQQSFFCYYLS